VLLLSHVLVLLFVRVYSQIADDGSGLCPCANCPDRCASTCGEDSLPPECISMRCYTGYGTCDDAIPGLEALISAQHNVETYESSSRIIGGTPVAEGKYPFFVQWGTCGGSLIHKDVVLTAAHCFEENKNIRHVYINVITRNNNPWKVSTEEIGIKGYDLHPKFNYKKGTNDFMLLFLKKNGGPTIQLAFGDTWLNKLKTVTVIGMGYTTNPAKGQVSDVLREVDLGVASPQDCIDAWKAPNSQSDKKFDKTSQLCLEGNKSKDSCHGDSGGPVFFKDKSGKFLQIAVVSYGDGDCDGKVPSVNGLVTPLKQWILDSICKYSNYNVGCPNDPFWHKSMWTYKDIPLGSL